MTKADWRMVGAYIRFLLRRKRGDKMRAVQTLSSPLVHLYDSNRSKTVCGLFPSKNASLVVHRNLFCMNCFGKDHGIGSYTASKLGLEKIYD